LTLPDGSPKQQSGCEPGWFHGSSLGKKLI
jgi:hypothetical protein